MNAPNKSEISRRRVFSLLGLGIVLGFAAPTAMLVASDAEAQTPGMERRQDRREGRHDRREDRREGTPTTDAPKKTEGAKATEDEKQ